MNQTTRIESERAALDDDTPSVHTVAPEEIEPLDSETLAAILAVDPNADPVLSAIIRDGLERAEGEERHEEEERRASCSHGSGSSDLPTRPRRDDV